MRKMKSLIVGLTIAPLLLVGCSSTPASEGESKVVVQNDQTNQVNKYENAEHLSQASSKTVELFNGVSVDYIVAKTNKELATMLPIVVTGEVLGFEEGRTWDLGGGDKTPAWKSVVMTLKIDKELKKSPEVEIPNVIYLEFQYTILNTYKDFQAAIPRGSKVVAYIEAAAPNMLQGVEIVDGTMNPKLVSGKNLFRASSPQALAIELTSNPGHVVFPMMSVEFEGPLSATFPDGDFIALD